MTYQEAPGFEPERTRSHRDLIVWRKAMALTVECHKLVGKLPVEEDRVLIPEIMSAAIAIPSRIAEGHDHQSRKHLLRQLYNARGALYRLTTLLEITRRVGYLDASALENALILTGEVERMLRTLFDKLETRRWE